MVLIRFYALSPLTSPVCSSIVEVMYGLKLVKKNAYMNLGHMAHLLIYILPFEGTRCHLKVQGAR